MQAALWPHEPLFVFDRCRPVPGCRYRVNAEGEGFLAGKMRDLGAEGTDDDILFLDGDKVPQGDIVADIRRLQPRYGCICYGVAPEYEHPQLRRFMKEPDADGVMPWLVDKYPYAYGCYSCGMWVCRDGIRKLRELNGGRIFHPAFDGVWGDEDNFLADELGFSGFTIGYSTHVRLGGKFGDYGRDKMWGFMGHFYQRILLRQALLGREL